MEMQPITLPPVTLVGREGSTAEGEGFITRLWSDLEAHFSEIAHLIDPDEAGNPRAFWGAMSDCARTFAPWEDDFTRGLYLAGPQYRADAEPPEGWSRWDIPALECLLCKAEGIETFHQGIAYLKARGIPLAAAVQDFTDPATGQSYMLFPIKRL